MAADVNPEADFPSFFWGGLIFLAVFLLGFALWKAFAYLRNRMEDRSGATRIHLETRKTHGTKRFRDRPRSTSTTR